MCTVRTHLLIPTPGPLAWCQLYLMGHRRASCEPDTISVRGWAYVNCLERLFSPAPDSLLLGKQGLWTLQDDRLVSGVEGPYKFTCNGDLVVL